MTEQVIRHRGAERDENGVLITATDTALPAMFVAPGTGSQFAERAREGESTAYTVYFAPGTDVKNDDELTVRGNRFAVIVNDWTTQGQGGVEVLCTRSQG